MNKVVGQCRRCTESAVGRTADGEWIGLCSRHVIWTREYNRIWVKRYREKRVKAGLCIFGGCSEPKGRGKHCPKHARYYAERMRAGTKKAAP